MTICEVCGNDYDESFETYLDGEADILDQFECAFYAVAPTCAHCSGKVVKHGIEINGIFFCCAHCASQHETVSLQNYDYEYAS
jgi:hypothetical protein